jgi:alpha-beta hydrolase superfamily lysophospholipase
VGQVAVICPPFGPEYTRSHRTLRHLADRLATSGIPTLRFDYEGTGDSAGDDDAPDRVGAWRRSVVAAAAEARRLSGCDRVCLIGVRLGATLAALEAEAVGADSVVLWNPVVKGRAFARELQAMALTADTAQAQDDDAIEAAGFRLARETFEAIKALDLSKLPIPNARVLVVDRDDLAGDPSLDAYERIAAPGWNGMMADHQFTVVPEAALEAIREWVAAPIGPRTIAATTAPRTTSPPSATTANPLGPIDERPARFGANDHLFGILAKPAAATDKPAVVLLNAGSIHHVGPHRLYVRLARELARRGHPVLRFDFEGIGDSILRAPGRENHPYVSHPVEDIRAALDYLRAEGSQRFILVGLCSGAYHVFKAGLDLRDAPIERLIAMNPWYFEWREGLSLDTTVNHYESVAAYRSAARDPARWKKLLRGEVDMKRLARVGWAHVAKTVRGRWDDFRETISPASGTKLSRDLRALGELHRPFHLIQSDGEPAETILATEAKLASRRLTRAKLLTIQHVRGADHTFSRSARRDALISRVVQLLG